MRAVPRRSAAAGGERFGNIVEATAALEGGGGAPHHADVHVSGFQAGAHVCESRGRRGEEQGHHPDILLGWGKAEVTTWTDKIDGLTDSQQAGE